MRAIGFGSTNLMVTPIGLGLAALGRPGYINLGRADDLGDDRSVAAMARRAHAVLDAAYGAGIRYVDVARSYGLAETFLASWLDQRQATAGSITVGSKWGYTYTAGWQVDAAAHEIKDHSLATLQRQWAESREILGDRLALYQIHSATLESGVLDDRRVLAELAAIASNGTVVGLTVSGPGQAEVIRRALDVAVDGVNPFGSVQATWNLLEPSAGPALAEAHQAGWGVIVKEPLANGRLTARGVGPDAELAARLTEAAAGATVDQVAMATALKQPWSDVVLSGAVTATQLESNVGALSVDPAGLLAESPHEYWAKRRSLRWS
jgi:aryl-alcohol dehydrogenase-like predicted oxidoreductase